ncbi:MAG TPA: molybdopterin-dependent oxidoreductase [Acidimicrobiales bacterium]|nr:molybdopterin-dependent oxidoreductase [Acidimicrobiales bacterium]
MTKTIPAAPLRGTPALHDDAPPALYAAIAGVLGAGVALGVGELFSGFSRSIPSLVLAVGDVFVDNTPGDATETAIRTLGTNNKPFLLTTIVVASLALGALVGVSGRRRRRKVAFSLAGFGLIGGWAAARVPGSSSLWSWTSAVVAAASGALVILGLLQALDNAAARARRGRRDAPPATSRRVFLTYSGGAAVAALAATGIGRGLRNSRSVSAARDLIAARGVDVAGSPADAAVAQLDHLDSIAGLSKYITPLDGNSRFYRIDTALEIPQVDPSGWKLKIGGLVDNPFELTYDELLAMPQEEHVITLSCVSNEIGGPLVGNAVWGGVPLRTLLERAQVRPSGMQIVGRSVDDFTAGFPTEIALDGRNAMLAIAMNGQPLPLRHGFPARLVVPGLYGYVSAVKWLDEIRLESAEYDGYWVPRGWSKLGPMKTMSPLDVPRDRVRVTAGRTAVAGVAWSPTRGIAAVEVQVDDGAWIPAKLGGAVTDETWLQWVHEWDATPGNHMLRVRATDKSGALQSSRLVDPRPDGAEGFHEITVTVV